MRKTLEMEKWKDKEIDLEDFPWIQKTTAFINENKKLTLNGQLSWGGECE